MKGLNKNGKFSIAFWSVIFTETKLVHRFTDTKHHKNIRKPVSFSTWQFSLKLAYQLGIGILYNEPNFHMHYRLLLFLIFIFIIKATKLNICNRSQTS